MENELIPLVAARFKALSDPHRLAILSRLKDGECSVSEFAEATKWPQPNVSQHLSSLSRAGLVEARRDGTRMYLQDHGCVHPADLRCGVRQPRRARQGRAEAP
jgi:DNA-binding transcriptional ArsR family regulator